MSADFFDTNVLVYMFDKTDTAKGDIAAELVEGGLRSGGVISFQVAQETLSVITRKITEPASSAQAIAFMERVLVPLWAVYPSSPLYVRTLEIQERYQFSFYDALIVAAALSAGCSRLLSEDLQDGQRIDGLTIVNPFK